MTQREIESIQFWLDITHRPITVTENMLKVSVFRNKLIETLNADIEINNEALRRQWNEKRLKCIHLMISIRDRLISDYAE